MRRTIVVNRWKSIDLGERESAARSRLVVVVVVVVVGRCKKETWFVEMVRGSMRNECARKEES